MHETKVKNIFKEKLEIHEDIIIERAHRTKGKTTRNTTTIKKLPKAVVIRLGNYKGKSMEEST